MQRKTDIRRIPEQVAMLFGKTAYAYSSAGMESSPSSLHFTNVALHLGSRADWVACLPSALYQLLCIQIESPIYLFFQLTHFSEVKCGDQTSTKQFLSDVSSHFFATQEPLLISLCRLLAIMTFPPRGNMPGLARIIGAW